MKTETYNKLKIALAVICFLIAAMFVAYAVIFIYNAVRVIFATEGANYGEYDYGVLLIFYVVIKPLSKIATAVCCAWFIFVIVIYLLDGISFIKKQSEYTEFKSRKRSLRLSFVFSVIHLIPLSIVFICGFGRVIKHGPEHELFAFLVFGLLPTILFTACIVINRLMLNAAKQEENARISQP